MRILHLLVAGGIGGIEVLMRDYALYSTHENHFLFAWSGGKIAEEIRESGNKVTILDKEVQGSRYVLKTIMDICKNEKIDSVMVHHEAPLLRGALLLVRILFPKIQIISYVHRNAEDMCGYGVKINWIKKIIYCISFGVSDEIIAISEFVKKSIINTFKVREDKIRVIYNGIDIKKYKPVGEKEFHNNLIYVGRLVEEKGVQTILKSLALLPGDIQYHLNVVGDGNYKNKLLELADKLGISKRVSFLGNRRDVAELLAAADVFIHVPIVAEGFGITVVEAMASGLVCVCSNNGALSEIITNGVDGYLIEKSDINLLKEMLCDICTKSKDEDIRIMAMRRSRDFSRERFVASLDYIINAEDKEGIFYGR